MRKACPFCLKNVAYCDEDGVWECDKGHIWKDWVSGDASAFEELRFGIDWTVLWIANATGLIHPTRRFVEWLARKLD